MEIRIDQNIVSKQILETSRLILREMESSDLDFIADMLGDSEVMKFWPKPYSSEEARLWMVRQRARWQRFQLAS